MLLPAEDNIINLKVIMSLGAFNILVCEQNCNIADIKIQGTKGQPTFVNLVSRGTNIFHSFLSLRYKWVCPDARSTNSNISPSERFHCVKC